MFHLARVFYIGKDYYGSQWQSSVPTIHGELVEALTKWSGKQYSVEMISFSGRTDKGVSSIGQIVQFESDKFVNIDKINKHLPQDIILWAHLESPQDFNPRFSVLSRHYRYYLDVHRMKLDIERIRRAARYLVGTNDYALLSKPDDDRNTIATLLNVSVTPRESHIVFDVFGVRFLWKLVRKIVTLLVEVGRGVYDPEIVFHLLAGNQVIPGGIEPASPECLVLIEALIPFRMKPSKNAIAMIRKTMRDQGQYHRRVASFLNGLSSDYCSSGKPIF